jgi:hypothetical protein
MRHRLSSVDDPRGRLGRPCNGAQAVSSAMMLRWLLWSSALLDRAAVPGTRMEMACTVLRHAAGPRHVKGVVTEQSGSGEIRTWQGFSELFDQERLLQEALAPWIQTSLPSVSFRLSSVEETPSLPPEWRAPFDPDRHRPH